MTALKSIAVPLGMGYGHRFMIRCNLYIHTVQSTSIIHSEINGSPLWPQKHRSISPMSLYQADQRLSNTAVVRQTNAFSYKVCDTQKWCRLNFPWNIRNTPPIPIYNLSLIQLALSQKNGTPKHCVAKWYHLELNQPIQGIPQNPGCYSSIKRE